ncbi:hypothetical protein [Paenibacillus sp. UMB7766-LJ446]|nr:hypothetical protein [Paenibacillus sp. UMB7766-LJ446]
MKIRLHDDEECRTNLKIAFITGFPPLENEMKKSGDNSDRKMVLQS